MGLVWSVPVSSRKNNRAWTNKEGETYHRWEGEGPKPFLEEFYGMFSPPLSSPPECTKIAHRRSLAIFTADEGIAVNSAARTIFTHFLRRRNRDLLVIFFAEEITHLGASKNRAIFWGAVKIAAAAAENRAILVHSVPPPFAALCGRLGKAT